MTDRSSKKSSSSAGGKGSSSSSAQRKSQFFINGEGIDREVITTDICRYLGNDALVKPGTHQDQTGRIQEGFYITAYRPPTSAQLADLRADSQKWREERQRGARSQGGYNESATRQEALRGGNVDEPRLLGGYHPASSYGPMATPLSATMGARPPEYGPRVTYTTNTAMPPPAAPGPYRTPTGGYQSPESNYIYGAPTPNPTGYNVMDSNRDRMETAPEQPQWSMPPSSGYTPSGVPPVGSAYPGRPTYSYSSVGTNQSVPTGYGRAEPSGAYSDPYGPRDSGVPPQPEPQGDYYSNDEDMEYEDTAAPAPAPAPAPAQPQPRRERERDSRERHDESRRKGHSHR